MMTRPLLASWRIRADELPDRLLDMDRPAPAFTLPGANALAGFADLIGGENAEQILSAQQEEDAPFPLPAMIPEDVTGSAALFLDVDFGALSGSRAVLVFDEITGSGDILLGDQSVARFGSRLPDAASLTAAPCAMVVDLTDALRRGRTETLSIRFDAARPAGVPGPVFLCTSCGGWLSDLSVTPSPAARTMTVRARIHAGHEGRYALRVTPQPERPGDPLEPAREITCILNPMESRECALSLSVPGALFRAGTPHRLAALRAELFYIEGKTAVPCDSALIAAGYPGRPAPYYVPLETAELQQGSGNLIRRVTEMHIPGVSLAAPAPDSFYLAASRAGVSVRQYIPDDHPSVVRLARHPCVYADLPDVQPRGNTVPSPEETAWQLCGMAGMPRTPDPDFTPADLLYDAAGFRLSAEDEGVRAVLSWLAAVNIRLRAEAARQRRFTGALCAPGQWTQEDISDALRTALAPLHLSALPLLGAWWTGTRFSASLEAFVPEDTAAQCGALTAYAVLEDEEGHRLARLKQPFRPRPRGEGAPIGVIEAALPDTPCVLTLTCRLLSGDTVLEESCLPVYVGQRGPLEAAF